MTRDPVTRQVPRLMQLKPSPGVTSQPPFACDASGQPSSWAGTQITMPAAACSGQGRRVDIAVFLAQTPLPEDVLLMGAARVPVGRFVAAEADIHAVDD